MRGHRTLIAGALLAAIGVALGAYGAHGLQKQLVKLGYQADLSERLAWFETGVTYQLYHALGLIVVASLAACQTRPVNTYWVSLAFVAGIFLFSGSLYAMTLLPAEWKKLGAVVPLGGLSFILGWTLLAYVAWRSKLK